MSLIKLLRKSVRIFQKDVISFLIIRRYDLGTYEEKLSYLAVSPSIAISMLRYKVWHLLGLPDFCDEVIVLKSQDDTQLPLVELCKGNTPESPFILEVWPPETNVNKMSASSRISTVVSQSKVTHETRKPIMNCSSQHMHLGEKDAIHSLKEWPLENAKTENSHAITNILRSEHMVEDKRKLRDIFTTDARIFENQRIGNMNQMECKKSDLTFKMSTSSIFFKMNHKRSREDMVNILLKIQNDLSTLSSKLACLETRVNS